jgi:hypothetical protein
MLITLLTQNPSAIVQIVKGTPTWVWGLLAGLVVLGASQLRDRTVSLVRVSIVPVAMTAFSVWGTVSAFGNSHLFGQVLAVWLGVAVAVNAAVAPGRSNATYDAAQRTYRVPGSVMPLLLIAGIFLVKWGVGVELALQPSDIQDTVFALAVAAVYGVFSGLFIGRAARLWRLAFRPAAAPITLT